MNILIVEDNPTDTILLKKSLAKAYPNAKFCCVNTSQNALEKIKNNKYACIFLDCNLPDQSGIDTLRQLYNPNTDLPPYPCVMITGQENPDLFMEAMVLGAQDYIQKTHITSDILFLVCEKAQYLFNLKAEKNEITRKYAHTQKIKAIGQLTGGIAHDFNNLLTVVLGNTQLVIEEAQKGHVDNDYLLSKMEGIRKSAQKGADLVLNLMSFSHQRSLKPEPLCINSILNDMRDFLTRTIERTITIEYDLQSDLWFTHADLSELEHLIINLCANARDAMPDGGKITVTTKNVSLDDDHENIIGLSDGEYIHLCVSDTGMGIEQKHIDKIFDPFFTTKDVGKGTGLGMSTVYSFVESCGGLIDVKSKKMEGTTFDIYLPKCDSLKKEQVSSADKIITDNIGSGTILVTEDEEDIRNLAVMILEDQGYKTIEAENSESALKIIQNPSINIDVLFTDIVMPGEINGVQLAARALVLRPDMKILFTTGYIKDHIPDINLLSEYDVLSKPYLPDEMISLMHETINRESI